MSILDETVSSIASWWNTEGADKSAKISNLKSEIDGFDHHINEISNRKSGYNPLTMLSNAWARATQIPDLEEKKSPLLTNYKNIKGQLTDTSAKHADDLVLATSQEDPDIAERLTALTYALKPLGDIHTTLMGVRKKTTDILNTIKTAWDETDDASTWETFDMIGSNAGMTFLSHLETSEAKEHLDKVGTSLKSYTEYMNQAREKLTDLRQPAFDTAAIEKTAQWDLWMGAFDIDIISFFTSWKNKDQLENAKDILEDIQQKIHPTLVKTNEALSVNKDQQKSLRDKYVDIRTEIVQRHDLPSAFYDYLTVNKSAEAKAPAPEFKPLIT